MPGYSYARPLIHKKLSYTVHKVFQEQGCEVHVAARNEKPDGPTCSMTGVHQEHAVI